MLLAKATVNTMTSSVAPPLSWTRRHQYNRSIIWWNRSENVPRPTCIMCKQSDCVSWHPFGRYLGNPQFTCMSLRSILIGEADEAGRCSLPIPSDYWCNHSVGSLHLQWHEVSLSFIHTRVCAQTQAHPYTCIFVSTFIDNVPSNLAHHK